MGEYLALSHRISSQGQVEMQTGQEAALVIYLEGMWHLDHQFEQTNA